MELADIWTAAIFDLSFAPLGARLLLEPPILSIFFSVVRAGDAVKLQEGGESVGAFIM